MRTKQELCARSQTWSGLRAPRIQSLDANGQADLGAIRHPWVLTNVPKDRRIVVFHAQTATTVCNVAFDRRTLSCSKFSSSAALSPDGSLYAVAGGENHQVFLFRICAIAAKRGAGDIVTLAAKLPGVSALGLAFRERFFTGGREEEVGEEVGSVETTLLACGEKGLLLEYANLVPLDGAGGATGPTHRGYTTDGAAREQQAACSPLQFEDGLLPSWMAAQGAGVSDRAQHHVESAGRNTANNGTGTTGTAAPASSTAGGSAVLARNNAQVNQQRKSTTKEETRRSLGRCWGRQTLVGKPVVSTADLAEGLNATVTDMQSFLNMSGGAAAATLNGSGILASPAQIWAHLERVDEAEVESASSGISPRNPPGGGKSCRSMSSELVVQVVEDDAQNGHEYELSSASVQHEQKHNNAQTACRVARLRLGLRRFVK